MIKIDLARRGLNTAPQAWAATCLSIQSRILTALQTKNLEAVTEQLGIVLVKVNDIQLVKDIIRSLDLGSQVSVSALEA